MGATPAAADDAYPLSAVPTDMGRAARLEELGQGQVDRQVTCPHCDDGEAKKEKKRPSAHAVVQKSWAEWSWPKCEWGASASALWR
jgi:hypothetical protein